MKKTVLVLGVLLSVGFAQVSCNRDDGLPTGAVAVEEVPVVPADPDPVDPTPTDQVIERTDLPAVAQTILKDILHEEGEYTSKNNGTTYPGTSVESVTKKATADETTGYVYEVKLSNGLVLGFGDEENGSTIANFLYAEDTADPKVFLKPSIWDNSLMFNQVKASVRALGTNADFTGYDNSKRYLTSMIKIQRTADKTNIVTFQDGSVKTFNEDGTEKQ